MDKKNSDFNEFITKNIISVNDGRFRILSQIDITTYGARAWAFTLQEIAVKKGKSLFKLGYSMGEEAANEIKEVINRKKGFLVEKFYQIENLIKVTGFGIVKIEGEKDKIILKSIKNFIIEYGKEKYGKNSKICSFYAGVYSAFINIFNNNNIKLNHIKCICNGDSEYLFSSK